MRWDELFATLEARFDELADAEASAEHAERERLAIGAVPMTARLSGALGCPLRVDTTSGVQHAGTLRSVGPDWLLMERVGGAEVIVALAGVTTVEGLTTRTGQPLHGVALRMDLRRVLRGLARDRCAVAVGVLGGAEITGTIDRVGSDFAELARHAAWEPRRAGGVRSVALVPLGAVVSVTEAPWG